MYYTTVTMHVGLLNVSGYKILCFGANLQKYQTLIPAKNSHLKVGSNFIFYAWAALYAQVPCPFDPPQIKFLHIELNADLLVLNLEPDAFTH